MQPVRRKKAPGPGRGGALLATACALGLLALLAILLLRPAATPETPPEDAPRLTLVDHDETHVARLTVSSGRSEPYTLTRGETGMALENAPDYPLRAEKIRVLTYYAAHLTADELVADADAPGVRTRLSDFGLDPGVCTVDVALDTGEQYTIVLGNAAPMEEVRYYARVSGDGRVYTVTSDVMDALNVPFYTLHPVTKPAVDAELIDRITLTGEHTFTAERGDAGWLMTVPFSYPLSDDAMQPLLSALENLRFSTWAAEASPENLALYGLDAPRVTLSLDFAASVLTAPDESGQTVTISLPESNITLAMGGAYSETADYYLYNGDIMTGTVVTFSFLKNLDWRRYVAASPFLYAQNNLSAMTVARGTETRTYAISYVEKVLPNNELATDENGSVLYEMRVRREGTAVDALAFSAYYERLQDMEGAAALEAPWTPGPEDAPLMVLTVWPEAGTPAVTVGVYAAPLPDRYVLTFDGTALYTVPAAWLRAAETWP